MDDHDLSVDDGFARYRQCAGNLCEAFSPVQPITGEDLLPAPAKVDLDAVAVELDFVKPLLALRRFGLQRRKLGFNEPRRGNTLWKKRNSQKARRTLEGTTGILLNS